MENYDYPSIYIISKSTRKIWMKFNIEVLKDSMLGIIYFSSCRSVVTSTLYKVQIRFH